MTEREYEPHEMVPDIPADAADFLDGEPPWTREEFEALPEAERRQIEQALAEKARQHAEQGL